jgi:histidyl-tRNA synthetase
MQKPSIPKGTRDFSPSEMVKREYIFETIRTVFKKYGYSPIETPAMENLTTLLGKYGEEGDKLLFKILNSGDYLAKADNNLIDDVNRFSLEICEKGLRYDLTVPFARYVVQNRNEITFPFKRYQIQPVWRADRPQKGRYREFYQCDADVIGSDSIINELELIQIIEEVFEIFGIIVTIKLNNRKLLAGIAEVIGLPDRITDITVAIDKLEKIGLEKVKQELTVKNIPEESISKLTPFLQMKGKATDLIRSLKTLLTNSRIGIRGIEEMESLFEMTSKLKIQVKLEFDLTLARGLNYYTGAIIEVKANDVEIGSVCGGGRYDDLTGIFGFPNVSGVGISFGADRIFDVMEQLKLFPKTVTASSKLLIVNFGEEEQSVCLELLLKIRREGISAEYYPDNAKLKKQMAYANSKDIPYVLLVGEEEIMRNEFTLKDMETGDQQSFSTEKLIQYLK